MNRRKRSITCPAGLTLLEVLISAFLVGVLVVASLNAATGSLRAQLLLEGQSRAQLLAQDLLTEIINLPYEDLSDQRTFGLEAGEEKTPRVDFDDVDDYSGWSSTPPTAKDGTPLSGVESWERSVIVEFVDPDDLMRVVADDRGVKQITVRVVRGATDLALMIAVVAKPPT